MKSLRRYAPLLGLLVFGALIWLGIYAYQDGFTKKWRKLIVKEFAKHDLTISFDTLTIDPFQGLVANKVVLLEGDTEQEIARVSQARLDVDLAKLIQSKRFLQRVELDSANVYLPYDRKDPNSQRVEFKDLQATVILPDGKIEIVNAEADFYGLRVSLTGDLKRPKESSGKTTGWETEKILTARPMLEKLVEHLAPLRSQQDRAPVLNMAVSGDLAHPESLKIEAQLTGKSIQYGELGVTHVDAHATITDQLFSLTKLTVSDIQGGRFDLSGDFPLKGERQASLSLSSSIDVGKLLPSMDPSSELWPLITLHESPVLSLRGTLDLDKPFTWSAPPVKLLGHVTAEDLQVGDESFELVQADVHLDGARFFARNIRIDHQYGKSMGKFIRTPTEGIRYEFSLGMDPTLLQQLPLPAAANTFLKRWEFRPNSGVEMTLAGERKAQDSASWLHKGKATLTGCRFETAEFEKLQFDFTLNPHVYHFSQIEAQLKPDSIRGYSGGTIRADRLSVSARNNLTVITGLHGTIDPGQVVRCFNTEVAESLDSYHFSQPPEIRVSQGTIDPQSGAQTNLEVEVKASGILETALFEEDVSIEQPRFGLRFLKNSLLVRLDHAGLFGGHVRGNGDIRNLDGSRDYTAKVNLTELEFKELASIYFPDRKADGQLTGNFAWRGRGTEMAAVTGKGEAHLRNAKFLDVPLLGPVSKLIDRVQATIKQPQEVIRDLGGPFSLQSSTLSLEPLVADLGNYQIKGNGTVELPNSAVDMTVSLSDQSSSQRALNILYEIFGTYQCTGTLKKPIWTMVNRVDATKAIQNAIEALAAREPEGQVDPEQVSELDPKALLKDILRKEQEKDTEEDR